MDDILKLAREFERLAQGYVSKEELRQEVKVVIGLMNTWGKGLQGNMMLLKKEIEQLKAR